MNNHSLIHVMNTLKCRTFGATLGWNRTTLTTACAISELFKITCNGKYKEDFSQKTENKEKEARCLTQSRIPGSV